MHAQAASGLLTSHAFDLRAPFAPTGDQPEAIAQLVEQAAALRFQTLKGATGTGKTFVMGQLIQGCQKPTLLLAPNKVLAAQLFQELSDLFPHNRVEYFVSYYDYFRPESYNATSGVYLDKVSQVNADIDRMRHSATRSLFERPDTIVVASISCIYGLGVPEDYLEQVWPGQACPPARSGARLHTHTTLRCAALLLRCAPAGPGAPAWRPPDAGAAAQHAADAAVPVRPGRQQ